MKIYCFGPEVGKKIEQFGSVNAIVSRIAHLGDEAVINSVYIRPHGKIGYHQAAAPQLFLVVEGEGWVKSESGENIAIKGGHAVFWEKDEWHESGTETGMAAVIIEGMTLDAAKLMPPMQEDEP